MMRQKLDELEAELRQAAAARQYPRVPVLAAEFGEAVRAYTKELPRSDPRAIQAVQNLKELFSWTLVMLRAARGDCAAELRRVSTANRYTQPSNDRTPAIHLDV